MGRYLVDSHTLLNFQEEPAKLTQAARKAIEDAGNCIHVSLASIWELAIKAANGKLPFYTALVSRGPDAVIQSLRESNFELLPITVGHALVAARLPRHHRDPFDRALIAQAMAEDLILISSDSMFPYYKDVRLLPA